LVDSDYIAWGDLGALLGHWDEKFDLCLCMNVLEHMHPPTTDKAISNLCHISDRIVFVGAPPHQSGQGHINCRPREAWVALFQDRDYGLDQEATDTITGRLAAHRNAWFPDEIQVFEKGR
jgi:hypothetical protein